MMSNFEEVVGEAGKRFVIEILRDGEDDWVMVDNILAYSWESCRETGKDPKRIAVCMLRFLLENDLMIIGDLGGQGVEPWGLSVRESLDRFIEGCEQYNWQPQGALWWLEITEEGEKWLRRHS